MAAGQKTSTTRWNESVGVGPVWMIFEGRALLRGVVERIDSYPLASLTPAQALQPEGTDMAEFAATLRRNYYPEMPDDAMVDVVTFRLARGPGQRDTLGR